MTSSSVIDRLQEWYESNCDGDWEHQYGVRIETIDNPGWSLEIDLVDTKLAARAFVPARVERTPSDWYSCRVADDQFTAACGPRNLTEVISFFLDWASS